MPSIQKRTLKNGNVSYRVQVRLKGHPIQRATFSRRTDAVKWAQATEAAIRERRYFKTSQSQKYTVSQMIERYLKKIERESPQRVKDVKSMLSWWDKQLGYCVLADLNRSIISQKIETLSEKTVERVDKTTGKKKSVPISTSRVNRYRLYNLQCDDVVIRERVSKRTQQMGEGALFIDENAIKEFKQYFEPISEDEDAILTKTD